MKKKILAICVCLFFCLSLGFCDNADADSSPMGILIRGFKGLFLSGIVGLLMSARFAYDIVVSYLEGEEGVAKRKKAIIRLLLTLTIVVIPSFSLINF